MQNFWKSKGRPWLVLLLLTACSSCQPTGQKEWRTLLHSVMQRPDIQTKKQEESLKTSQGRQESFSLDQTSTDRDSTDRDSTDRDSTDRDSADRDSADQDSARRGIEEEIDLPDIDPRALEGVAAQAFSAAMGRPLLKNREADNERWVYRAKSCILDVFFYRGKLSYMEARNLEAEPLELSLCLKDYQQLAALERQ